MNKSIFKRLSEPSTFAGLAGLAVAFGLSADEFNVYASAIAGVFAVVAMLMSEGTKADPE